MKRWHIANIGDTDIYMHPAFCIYTLYAMLTGHTVFLFVSTVSILLHEAAHALASAAFGVMPLCVELMPIGAVMRIEDDCKLLGIKRYIMLLSGPLMSFALCYIALRLTVAGILSASLGHMFFISNVSILTFNLLPVLPLDGGRILSVFLDSILPPSKVHRIMKWIGTIVGIGLILLNIYATFRLGGWNLSLAFAGCCILYSSAISTTTYAFTELRHFLDRKIMLEHKGWVKGAAIYALNHTPISRIIRNLPPNNMADIHCIEAGTMRKQGTILEAELIQSYMDKPDITLGQALILSQNMSTQANSDTI